MKHVYKACADGDWKTKSGETYDVQCIHMKDKTPKGYSATLESALKKKAPKAAPTEALIGENG